MKYLIICLTIFALETTCVASENLNFGDSVFNLSIGHRVPDQFLIDFMGKRPSEWARTVVKDISIVDGTYRIIFDDNCNVGVKTYLIVFSKDGEKIDSLDLEEHFDCDGGEWRTYSGVWLNKNSYKKTFMTLDSCYTREYLESYEVADFRISKEGKITKSNLISYHRTKWSPELPDLVTSCDSPWYTELSEYKLTDKALENISENEARLMRNEIFARHGYEFSDGNLSYQFSKCKWYEPLSTNVDSKLNDIEKFNTKLLLSHEKSLR